MVKISALFITAESLPNLIKDYINILNEFYEKKYRLYLNDAIEILEYENDVRAWGGAQSVLIFGHI